MNYTTLEIAYVIQKISYVMTIISGSLFVISLIHSWIFKKYDYFIEEYDEKTNKLIKRTKITEEEYYSSTLPEYKRKSIFGGNKTC